jgi:hypothetical protein
MSFWLKAGLTSKPLPLLRNALKKNEITSLEVMQFLMEQGDVEIGEAILHFPALFGADAFGRVTKKPLGKAVFDEMSCKNAFKQGQCSVYDEDGELIGVIDQLDYMWH